jgi:hypothetical protein
MSEVIEGFKNHNTHEAKDILASQIVEKAQPEGTA